MTTLSDLSNNQLILQTVCAAGAVSGSIKSTVARPSQHRLALTGVFCCWRIMCQQHSNHLRGLQRLSFLLKQRYTFIQQKISFFHSFGRTLTDLPPRCHGNVAVLSTLSKLQWFIDLWLAQLGSIHENRCSQWQKTSCIMKRWKERADRKTNSQRAMGRE